jgi:LacI family transcriptional regulator
MATIYDVARRAGVSTYTVSAVLNRSAYVSPPLTQRVLEAVRALDYTINDLARSLQRRETRIIGMLIPDIANPFYAKVVRGVEDVLKKAGYSLLLGNTYDDPGEQARYVAVFRSKQVDGLIVFVAPGEGAEVRRLVEAHKPVVFVSRKPMGFEADTVAPDSVKGTRLAVQHLIRKGHRRIGIIVGPASLTVNAERILGWRRALRAAGLPADERLIGDGDGTPPSALRLTLALLDLDSPPTAIFASSFPVMTGVLTALKERGLTCPAEVEVMSSDEHEWLDLFEPRISTVVQPNYTMGAEAAQLLLKRVRHPKRRCQSIVLAPELRIRD